MLTTAWVPNGGPIFGEQLFAIGDVHGRSRALGRLLDHIDDVERSERRELIFLGDLIDRGPDSLGAVHRAWSAADRVDRCWILPGNHELMMMAAIDGDLEDRRLWLVNGGQKVLDELDPAGTLPEKEIWPALRKALPSGFEEMMRSGDTHVIKHDVLFVHAGLHPESDRDTFLNRDRFNTGYGDHWAWIRQPFLGWDQGWCQHGLSLVVHGHSPASTEAIRTTDEAEKLLDQTVPFKRICLDAGSMRREQVAAIEFLGSQHRLHVAEDHNPV